MCVRVCACVFVCACQRCPGGRVDPTHPPHVMHGGVQTWLIQELCDGGALSASLYGGRFHTPAAAAAAALAAAGRGAAAAADGGGGGGGGTPVPILVRLLRAACGVRLHRAVE